VLGKLQYCSLHVQPVADCRVLFLDAIHTGATYVHVQCLSIASASTCSRCYHDQLIFGDKVADATLFACRLMARVGLDVEFERCHERQDESEEELEREKHVGGIRLEAACLALTKVVLAIEMCCAVFRTRCYWWSEGARKCFRVVEGSCPAARRTIGLCHSIKYRSAHKLVQGRRMRDNDSIALLYSMDFVAHCRS